MIFPGQGDIFFTPEESEPQLKDLPEAEMHPLAAGHFAIGRLLGLPRGSHPPLLWRDRGLEVEVIVAISKGKMVMN
jgi:hypothetical protein